MKKRGKSLRGWQRITALLLVIAMMVTLIPGDTGVQAAQVLSPDTAAEGAPGTVEVPETVEEPGTADVPGTAEKPETVKPESEKPETAKPESEKPETAEPESEKPESADGKPAEEPKTDGKQEENVPAAKEKDWSSAEELIYRLAGLEETEKEMWYSMKLYVYWEELAAEEGIRAKDKFSFVVPKEWFKIEDTKEAVPVSYGDIEDIEKEDVKLAETPVADYEVKDQKVTVTFREAVEKIEDIASVFSCVELSVRVQREALTEEEQKVEWEIQTHKDETAQKLELTLPKREIIDWAERTDDFAWELKEEEEAGKKSAQILFGFLRENEDVPVLAGDTAWIPFESKAYKLPDTKEPKAIYGTAGEKEEPIAFYIIEEGDILLTFEEGIEKTEALTEVKGAVALEISEENVQTPADPAEDMAVPLADKMRASILGSIPFGDKNDGGIEVTFTAKDYQVVEQRIWWVDNNDTKDRYDLDKYKQLFCGREGGDDVGRGSLTAIFTDDENNTYEAEFDVKDLIERGLLSVDNIMVEEFQGGYRLSVKEGTLPKEGSYKIKDESEKEKEVKGTFEWAVNPPKRLNVDDGTNNDIQNYYFVNVENPADYTTLPIEPGWYYIKNHTFKIHVQVRKGDYKALNETEPEEKLVQALEKQLHFYYKQQGTDEEYQDIALKELLDDITHDTRITWNKTEDGEHSEYDFYELSIENLPLYRVDGLEQIFYVQTDNGIEEQDNNIIHLDFLGEDWLTVTYENDQVGNFGSVLDKAHNNGEVILTLTGNKVYKGTKEWKDEAREEEIERPGLEFRLYRYTKKKDAETGEYVFNYKDASPVKNNNGKGDFVKITVPEGTSKDSFEIDFTEGKEFVTVGFAEGEKLPKYDPEGYEYIYFVREEMSGGDAGSYETIYGKVEEDQGELTVQDKLPEGIERDGDDHSIYNGGTVTNRLKKQTSAKVEKRWEAASFQDELKDIIVEMTLQVRPKAEEGEEEREWQTAKDQNGEEIKKELDGFKAEQLTQDEQVTVEKYDLLGRELEYRFTESAIYKVDLNTGDRTEIEIGEDGSFTLNQGGHDVAYQSETEPIPEDEGGSGFETRIVNRMKDKVKYVIEKRWQNADGTPIEAPKGAEVWVELEQRNHLAESKIINKGNPFVLDGEADKEPKTLIVTCVDGAEAEISYQETSPWHLEITGLPKYDKTGHIYDYMALETKGTDGYKPKYSIEYEEGTDTYTTVITNSPGEGQSIYVRKNWIDDSDVLHRGKVAVSVYEYNKNAADGEKYRPLTRGGKTYTAELYTSNFWWTEIPIPADVETKNLFIVETKVGDTNLLETVFDSDKPDDKGFTQEQLADIYEAQQDTGKQSKTLQYETEQHLYRHYYSLEEGAGGNKFYTVTNQRLGRINLTATKYWKDGDGEAREELAKELEDKGYGLYLRLSCVEAPEAIDYEKNTITIGNDRPMEILEADSQTRSAALQKVEMLKGEAGERAYYFYNLPKYNTDGSILHYQIEEVVLDLTKDKEADAIKNAPTLAQAKSSLKKYETEKNPDGNPIETEYSASVTESEYEVGEQHTEDEQYFEVTNRLTGVKDVTFYKQWKDAYRYEEGQRPDIALNIYQLKHKKNADGALSWDLVSYYKDYKWDKAGDGSHGGSEVWKIELKDVPKYDEDGDEIIYYGQEIMRANGSTFDYIPVYYKHKDVLKEENAGTDRGNSIRLGDESGVAEELNDEQKKQVTVTDVSQPVTDGNSEQGVLCKNTAGIHLLMEGGTFVNQVEEDVLVEGKKLWTLGGNKLPSSEFPEVTFYLYRKENADDKIENPNPDEAIAWVRISDWKSVEKDGTYLFGMKYIGENCYAVQGGTPVITDAEGKGDNDPGVAATIPQYDDNGNIHYYEVVEVVTGQKEGASADSNDWNGVYNQPVVNGYMISNVYNPEKGSLKVKKYMEPKTLDEGENYPSISFKLTRKYKSKAVDANGEPVYEVDTGFEQTKTIKWNEFVNGEAELEFTGLEVYAPNGTLYRYVVTENAGNEFKGYTVYSGEGDLDRENVTSKSSVVEGITLKEKITREPVKESNIFLRAWNAVRTFFTGKEVTKDVKSYEGAATFKNVHTPEQMTIMGTKQWSDLEDEAGVRPSIDQANQVIKLTLKRSAKAQDSQGGGNSIPEQIVDENTYTVDWSMGKFDDKGSIDFENGTKENANKWVYTIKGKGSELEIYAPNGARWDYTVAEEILPPYDEFYIETHSQWVQGEGSAGHWEPKPYGGGYYDEENKILYLDGRDATGKQQHNALSNHMTKMVRSRKKWIAEGTNAAFPGVVETLGYKMQIVYVVQAQVLGKLEEDENGLLVMTGEKQDWMDLDTVNPEKPGLCETIFAGKTDYPRVKVREEYALNGTMEKRYKNVNLQNELRNVQTYIWPSAIEGIEETTNGGLWNEVQFYELLNVLKATQDGTLGTDQKMEVKSGDRLAVQYRIVEREMRYYDKNYQVPVYGNETAPPVYGDGEKQDWIERVIYENPTDPDKGIGDDIEYKVESPKDAVFGSVKNQNGNSVDSYLMNYLPTVNLRIKKTWEDQTAIAMYTRPQCSVHKNGIVYFSIQRRKKGSTEEGAWKPVKKYEKNGTESYLIADLHIPNSYGSNNPGQVDVKNLPQYDWEVGKDGKVTRIEYEYRGMEIAVESGTHSCTEAKKNFEAGNFEIVEEGGYTGLYQVTYKKRSPNETGSQGVTNPEVTNPKNPKTDPTYITHILNTMRDTELYAEKDWRDEDSKGEPEITVPVTLKVQYLSYIQETNEDGTPKFEQIPVMVQKTDADGKPVMVQKTDENGDPVYEIGDPIYQTKTEADGQLVKVTQWLDVPGDTDVLLDGKADAKKLHYEYEGWKAKWTLPSLISHCVGYDEENPSIQYRVVEVTNTSYPIDDESTAKLDKGEGTETNPYIFKFNQAANGTAGNPYKMTDAPTELKISKTVSGGSETEEFTFTIKAATASDGEIFGETAYATYQRFKKGTDGSDTKVGTLTKMDLSDGKTAKFNLRHDEYIIVYGLVMGAKYDIAETGMKDDTTDAFDEYKTTVTCTGVTAVTPDIGAENADKKVTITTPGEIPEDNAGVPEVAYTNSKNDPGSITIKKEDEKKEPLSDVVFQIKWRKKGDTDTAFKELTQAQCGNPEIVTGEYWGTDNKKVPGTVITGEDGTALFDELILSGNTVYEYQITELKTKDGYNILKDPVIVELPYVTEEKATGSAPYKEETEDGKTYYYYKDVTITISNNQVFTMPNTAGSGFFWPGILGLAVLFGGGVLYILREEKRRKGNRPKS